MRNPNPKIRKYQVSNVSDLLIDINRIEVFTSFLPINTKYYKLISAEIENTDSYMNKNINFVFEKLQNLVSYSNEP